MLNSDNLKEQQQRQHLGFSTLMVFKLDFNSFFNISDRSISRLMAGTLLNKSLKELTALAISLTNFRACYQQLHFLLCNGSSYFLRKLHVVCIQVYVFSSLHSIHFFLEIHNPIICSSLQRESHVKSTT